MSSKKQKLQTLEDRITGEEMNNEEVEDEKEQDDEEGAEDAENKGEQDDGDQGEENEDGGEDAGDEPGEEEEEDDDEKEREKEEIARRERKKRVAALKKRPSLWEGFSDKQELFRPEYRLDENDQAKKKMWELMETYLPRDKLSIQQSIVKHIEYTLSTTRFDVNAHYLFQGAALSIRDRLLEQWNDTHL